MRKILTLALVICITSSAFAAGRKLVIFIADGLRHGSVNATDAPTMLSMRQNGVHFANSHSLFPTFTTANASAIATGHYLGDTGDFSNTIYIGYPLFNTGNFNRSGVSPNPVPFLEEDQTLCDINDHYHGNYLNEETLLYLARQYGYRTAAVGKLGPAAIQDVAEVRAANKKFAMPAGIIIDDATGGPAGVPLDPAIQAAIAKAKLTSTPTKRQQDQGNNVKPGTLSANIGQQQWFVKAVTEAILPAFKASGKPFVLVFWSRDPDGTQHSQGDSLNKLSPGINGPTSLAAVKNADNNLKQILDYINSDPQLAANTDIFLTSDHGFATVSRHDIDAAGRASASYSTKFSYYKDGRLEVNAGFMPPGFLAIDLAHALGMSLHDPNPPLVDDNGVKKYALVDPANTKPPATTRQRPVSGNGLIGASGRVLDQTDAKVIVAANGGSDLIYVPDNDSQRVRAIVSFLLKQDYVDAIFVDDRFGKIPGALRMSSVRLKGATPLPTPAIAVGFKTFPLDPANPLMTAVQIADTNYQQGQGMHGSFGRDNTFNNMAAMGPDFKKGYVDQSPVSNADITPTLARVLGFKLPAKGKLQGRVLAEALEGGPETVSSQRKVMRSGKADGKSTLMFYQRLGQRVYFDEACLVQGKASQASCH